MKTRIAALAAALLAGTSLTGAVQAQTLEDALAAAYLYNPTLAAQRASLRATDEAVPQALSGWRPVVQATGSIGALRTELNVPGTDANTRNPRTLELTVSQPVYTGGRVGANVSAAENTVLAGRARLTAVEQSILLAAVTAYLDVVRDQAIVELTRNNVQVLRRQLEATQDRFRVGEVTRTDVSQAEARVARAMAEQTAAEGALEASRANYLQVVGELPGRLDRPEPSLDLPASKEEAVRRAINEAPGVLEASFGERAARDRVDAVAGELLPQASILGEIGRDEDVTSDGLRLDSQQVVARLVVPLYQAGAVYSRVREAKQTAAQQRELVDQARREAVETATAAWEAWQTARARVTSFAAQIRSAELALEGVQREAQVGARTILDVLNAEQELLDARVNLVDAQRTSVVAAYQLKASIGELTAANLKLPVPTYDPSIHYREVRGKWFGTDVRPEKER